MIKIKNYTLVPSEENVCDMLCCDSIKRNKDIIYFINLLENIEDNAVIALDGKWGDGKTFFVKQVKLLLDYYCKNNDLDNELNNKLNKYMDNASIFKDMTLYSYKYHSVYYDAWENDNDEDPLLSIIYAILKDENSKLDNDINIINLIGSIIDLVYSKNISKALKELRGEDLLKKIKEERNIRGIMAEFFDKLIIEKGNKLIIFIDELDRCKPSYAIKLLEKIKHYFNDPRVIFVFSVNIDQLQHTIKKYYGELFDSRTYLDKFFDYIVSLSNVDLDNYCKELGLNEHNRYEKYCKIIAKYFKFSLREINRFIMLTKIAYNARNNNIAGFSDEKAYKFGLIYLVPILIALKMKDNKKYELFINGYEPNLLIDILCTNEQYMKSLLFIFNDKEIKNIIAMDFSQRIKDIYYAFFRENDKKEIDIGEMTICSKTKNSILEVASLLSREASYDF